ncbi:MAG: hypothetical protein A4E31_01470 [Methanomassiliicoccales archaeon PtaU1.Bin030]|nr:MAG: hypothetical protein A4E31_01470 [Methanomassiliicoccales archaeon PtaU1.Bin030]
MSVKPQMLRSGVAISATSLSMTTSVARRSFFLMTSVASGTLADGSATTVIFTPRFKALENFVANELLISRSSGDDRKNLSLHWSKRSPILESIFSFPTMVYTSWGVPLSVRVPLILSRLVKVRSSSAVMRSFISRGGTGWNTAGRPPRELTKFFLCSDSSTL